VKYELVDGLDYTRCLKKLLYFRS